VRNPITSFYANMTPERRLTFETYLTVALLLLILLQFWLLTWMPGEAGRIMHDVNQAKAELFMCRENSTSQFNLANFNITNITK
jgi:hypothetical protein